MFCRDSDSLEYLRQRGLLNASSGFRPDSTFFFNAFDDPWADAFMQSHGLRNKQFITVIIRTSHTAPPVVGIPEPDREKQHMEKLKGFIEGWIERTGMSVLICPESKLEVKTGYDKLCAILSPAAQKKCVCMDAFWTPEQACAIYRRARIVTGHMHTIIFAIAVGTPVLHIQFAEAGRKAWMVKDVGFGDWLLDIDEASSEELLRAALQIHEAYDLAEARVQKALPEIERLGLEVISEVKAGWRG